MQGASGGSRGMDSRSSSAATASSRQARDTGLRTRGQSGVGLGAGATAHAAAGDGAGVSITRFDSSLGLLTRRFVDLIKAAPGGTLDLNAAAKDLEVQKRRIYDITNVLEGIGLIHKTSKNHIQWKGSGDGARNEENEEEVEIQEDIYALAEQEARVDQLIAHVKEQLKKLPNESSKTSGDMFLHQQDIRGLPCYRNNTVMAIRAPAGTTLEVPDPDEGMPKGERRYQIYLKSPSGPIDVYVVSQVDERIEHGAEDANADGAGVTGNVCEPGQRLEGEDGEELRRRRRQTAGNNSAAYQHHQHGQNNHHRAADAAASAPSASSLHRGQEDARAARHSRLQQPMEVGRGPGGGAGGDAGRHPFPAGQRTPARVGGPGGASAAGAAGLIGGTTPGRAGAGAGAADYPALAQGDITSPSPGGYRGLSYPANVRQSPGAGLGVGLGLGLTPLMTKLSPCKPEPDFSYNMFDHGLTELFVGAGGGAQAPGAGMHGDDMQQADGMLDAFFDTPRRGGKGP